ncbi:MAG: DUF5989 family protein [Verrucomicrobia bacterium]|nr:DUF5989 family protein [Verrucomicrobiota bacterium]
MSQRQSEFEKASANQDNVGLIAELWGFLKDNRKWWMLPILILLLVLGLLIVLGGTGLAPLIYTLF